jgi:uncharacterized protein YdhG (YjbR/CyaY superfamily)
MARTWTDVEAYLADQPAAARKALTTVRRAIRRALPAAAEVISYQIPTYKIDGRPVIYFAGWKEHLSLYPVSAALVAAFASELEDYEFSKGTLRIPLTARIPASLIQRIAGFRAKETGAQSPRRRVLATAVASMATATAPRRQAATPKTSKTVTPPRRAGAKRQPGTAKPAAPIRRRTVGPAKKRR